ncbi:MAG: DNA repair protein RadC [Chloroflexota bacterium]
MARRKSDQSEKRTAESDIAYRTLKDLHPEERPREKLLQRGSQALSDGELIAILLATGSFGETVTDLAQRMIGDFGGLYGLMQQEVKALTGYRGVGEAKAISLKAALELGRRLAATGPEVRPEVTSPEDVANLLAIEMGALEQEQVRVVMLDTKHRVMAIRTIDQGTANEARVRVSEVFKEAVRSGAVAVAVVHNHPSGDPTPSSADVSLTVDLEKAGKLLDIDVLDHLIIGRGRWTSLRRLGLGFSS